MPRAFLGQKSFLKWCNMLMFLDFFSKEDEEVEGQGTDGDLDQVFAGEGDDVGVDAAELAGVDGQVEAKPAVPSQQFVHGVIDVDQRRGRDPVGSGTDGHLQPRHRQERL